jgi:hypothetical protein
MIPPEALCPTGIGHPERTPPAAAFGSWYRPAGAPSPCCQAQYPRLPRLHETQHLSARAVDRHRRRSAPQTAWTVGSFTTEHVGRHARSPELPLGPGPLRQPPADCRFGCSLDRGLCRWRCRRPPSAIGPARRSQPDPRARPGDPRAQAGSLPASLALAQARGSTTDPSGPLSLGGHLVLGAQIIALRIVPCRDPHSAQL